MCVELSSGSVLYKYYITKYSFHKGSSESLFEEINSLDRKMQYICILNLTPWFASYLDSLSSLPFV